MHLAASQLPNLDEIARHRAWFLTLGIVLITLGVVAVAYAVVATIASVLLFGWLLLLVGVAETVHGFRTHRWGGFFLHLLVGLLDIALGLLFLLNPLAGALTLTLLIGAFFIVEGLFRLIGALTVRFPNWGWAVAGGIITTVLGLLLVLQWPVSGLWLIGFAAGIDMIFRGWGWVMLTLAVRSPARPAAQPRTG